ncbi:DUF4231 domain-containing protein [Micromonospora sp. WMMA1363]|uniref:DUF4231 domain-containing protein n=1 Tax=Micromonospora sp. WMMA1363 TaxID=3053985 RepID=UPI00259D1106|nr:DUF4231 domain-containing protein [Micromonospora sp. WMMA1363]MDM4719039.1 DUF4231 domain-containing protein [Micromonospora sp. WMMA1363]
MSTVDPQAALEAVWQQQGIWSAAADTVRRRIVRGRRLVAGLTVVAAVAGTAAAQLAAVHLAASRALAIVAGAALGLVPLAARSAGREPVQVWTRLRAVAESLKAEVHRRLAGVTPYRGADRDAVLLSRVDAVLDEAGDLVGRTVDVAPPARPLPAVSDVESYLVLRVGRQVERYYLPEARRMAAAMRRIRAATTGLTVVGALLSAAVGVLGDGLSFAAWVGVVATVTTAVVGYGAAQQYEQHQIEYARTADQLARLRRARRDRGGWTDDDAVVAEAERLIALSNEAWTARTLEEDGIPHR